MTATVTAGENLKVLKGDAGMKAAGDFVRSGQKMAKEEGFGGVSRLWYAKTQTYEQGLAKLSEGRAKTNDMVEPLSSMTPGVNARGQFVMRFSDGREFRPTVYAVSQIGSWAGAGKWYAEQLATNPSKSDGSVEYVRDREDAETLAAVVRNGLRRLDANKKFLWRTHDDGTLRAMLSDQYACVDNRWFIEALSELVPGGRLSHWRGDSDTIFGNILIPDTIREESDSDYGGMLSVGNSEIGVRRLSSTPSIFRSICMNGCIWGQKKGEKVQQLHRGKIVLAELRAALEMNLQKQIPLLPGLMDGLLSTRRMQWDGQSILPLFAELADEFSLTRKQASGLLTAYNEERSVTPDYERTLFSVVNAFTRAGQKLDNMAWVKFDQIGGQLTGYSQNDWERLAGRAKQLSVDEVDRAFSVAA